MGCCLSNEDEKSLLYTNETSRYNTTRSSPTIATFNTSGASNSQSGSLGTSLNKKDLPTMTTLVGTGNSSVFKRLSFDSHLTTTFSVINDAEQRMLDSIVLYTEKDLIDVSRHVQPEPTSAEYIKEKINRYRNHEKKSGFLGSPNSNILPEIFVLPSIDDESPSPFIKSSKFSVHLPSSNEDVQMVKHYLSVVHDAFLGMNVIDYGPVVVDFDV
eukprot:TRINITY_DN16018_c0_g1_i1.p1 TRINITY_DN16018_c0_g1~~TRINITY_DN16018_c0_g1_i1.p1  ORF type:complete len:214 (-),score=35.08 TRINITY_DN16018_c0_g1_i1:19-660(-)